MPSDDSKLRFFSAAGLTTGLLVLLSACAGQPSVGFSAGHVVEDDAAELTAPPVQMLPAPVAVPEPELAAEQAVETYTVVVKSVPAVDLLFSLARDAELELDMQADSNKKVTLNAVDRPLHEILARIVATQIATSGGTVGEETSTQGDGQGNLSRTTVRNLSQNDFWTALEFGLEAIVKDSTTTEAESTPAENDPVIVNRMSGVVTILGNQKQHFRVQEHLNSIMANSQRQVLIEMTIVEVELSDNYQAGVDWQRLSSAAGAGNNGASLQSNMLGANLGVPPFFTLGYNDDDPNGGNISATVKMLQQFGDTKVLSSPKIMALNNQTALLKVVNENVFFTVELDIRDATADIPERRTYTSELHTVPVGLVLSVTPQVSNSGFVSLNVRPTISRITGFAVDPAPRLAGADFDNLVPEIQVREIESLLKVRDGRTIVLGGLMQNEHESSKDGVPGLSRIPKLGKLFSYDSDRIVKTELVIFLKPTIVNTGAEPASNVRLADYYDVAAEQLPARSIEYR